MSAEARSRMKRDLVAYLNETGEKVKIVVVVDVDGVNLPAELTGPLEEASIQRGDGMRPAVLLELQSAYDTSDEAIMVPMAFSSLGIDWYQCRIPWVAIAGVFSSDEHHQWKSPDAPSNLEVPPHDTGTFN